jgi:hypothetical protein
MADTSDTTKINLTNDITVNGRTYKAGSSVEVPKAQADDIARMDYDHNNYIKGLNQKHTYTVDAGSIAVGGGAQ